MATAAQSAGKTGAPWQRVIAITFLLVIAALPGKAQAAGSVVAPMSPPLVRFASPSACATAGAGSGVVAPLSPTGLAEAVPGSPPVTITVPACAAAASAPAPVLPAEHLSAQPPPDCILRDNEGHFLGWFDYQHCRLSGDAMASANWFDKFFGNWHPGQARLLLRVITQEQWDRKAGTRLVTNVQAVAHLPNADQRLRLVISDDRNELFGHNPDQSPEYMQQQSTAAIAALRFIGLATRTVRLESDAGVRAGPDAFLRLRGEESARFDKDTVLQTGEMTRYAVQDKGRADIHADLLHAVASRGVLRFSNDLSYWEKEDHLVGARWSQGISWSQSLSPLQSIAVGLSTAGVTRPAWARGSYGPWLLYRTALYQDWVFYEIQPQLTRYAQYDWRTVPSVVLRLEIQIGRK